MNGPRPRPHDDFSILLGPPAASGGWAFFLLASTAGARPNSFRCVRCLMRVVCSDIRWLLFPLEALTFLISVPICRNSL